MSNVQFLQDDVLNALATLPSNYFHGLLTDPPAGISFLDASWDHDKGGRTQWISWFSTVSSSLCRILVPGAYGLVWSLPRTSHWTAMGLENGGLEIIDSVHHVFGSGMPKSLNSHMVIEKSESSLDINDYGGYGTGLTPSHEVWWLVRKPIEGRYIDNLEKHGTGFMDIDNTRIAGDHSRLLGKNGKPRSGGGSLSGYGDDSGTTFGGDSANPPSPLGLWPKNLVFTETGKEDCPVSTLKNFNVDAPSFFYQAKPSVAERELGLEGMEKKGPEDNVGRDINSKGAKNPRAGAGRQSQRVNNHPTLKSIDLTTYFAKLILPPKNIGVRRLINPFSGSGSEAIGGLLAGWEFIVAIEQEADYNELAKKRIEFWRNQSKNFETVRKTINHTKQKQRSRSD